VAAFAVLLVSAMTVAFTNASGARSIAANSELLQWSNVTSGASAITRAALNQAVVFAIDEELGVSSTEATQVAIDEADRTVAELKALTIDAPADLGGVAGEVAGLVETAEAVVRHLREEDTNGAIAILDAEFGPRYAGAANSLAATQALYAAAIDAAESTATQIENAMQWLATLLIPGIAILLYRIILRRRFERRKLEFEARLTAERELNVAKDEIIAGISHELRTPLTSILGFSQHLLDHGFADEQESVELLSMINRDSEELARMVEDLLTAARIESEALTYDFGPVDLKAEARSITEHIRASDIEILIEGNPTPVWADAVRTRQIIRNLISNAAQHGGPTVRLRIREGETVTTCDVIDDGPGVPDAITDRLFERFVHEGPQSLLTGSVGLGLAIARSLASAMGGDVTYTRGEGTTTFSLELPIAKDAAALPPTNGSPSPETRASRSSRVRLSDDAQPVSTT
jgi:signal transduction histidine kinase